MFSFFIVSAILLPFLEVHDCSQCPAVFRRFSRDHSYCKARNPRCTVFSVGLKSEGEKDEILREHNKYRSSCALGNETRAGGLPTAADMMQMVWDDELAAVAQKWAEQCDFNHDCDKCRSVYDYAVGQNIGYKQWSCPNGDCRSADKRHPHNWSDVIKMFTDEIKVFNKNLVKAVQFDDQSGYGHLTQIIWAKTWRVGCGFVAHLHGNEYRQLYVCNYGPTGNVLSEPIYTAGKPCSECPLNACCGETCKKGNGYPGLCRMIDDKSAPVYRDVRKNTAIFHTDFGKGSQLGNRMSIKGTNKWRLKSTHSGNIMSITLNGGESSTLLFNRAIVPSASFCFTLKYRKGPNVANQENSNRLEMLFEPEKMLPIKVHIKPSSSEFFTYNLDLNWKAATKFSLTFSVPPKALPQYLDLQSIVVSNGVCKINGNT